MIPLNIPVLLEHLKHQRYDVHIQEGTQQLYMIFSLENGEFPLFIKVDSNGTVLQFLLFMPCSMTAKAPPQVAMLLHMINKEIDLPGFGMDDNTNVVFYRCVIPTSSGKIDKQLIDGIMVSLPHIVRVFFPVIADVASGTYLEAIRSDLRESFRKFTVRK